MGNHHLLNLAAAATVFGGAWRTAAHGGVAGWAAATVQVGVAIAFLARSPERRAASGQVIAAALPSVVLGAAVFPLGADRPWPWPAASLAAAGAAFTLAALVALGRSFAVLPGVRELRSTGPYRLVRHPMYLGELLMVGGAAVRLGPPGGLLLAGAVAAVAWRVRAEERLWTAEPGWAAWAESVPWRLVPGVW